MSLGTSRLCSDQGAPAPSTRSTVDLSAYDGSTPIACLEWNRVLIYREPARTRGSSQPSIFPSSNLTRGIFNGYMSPATRRKVRRSVSTWIRSIWLHRSRVKELGDRSRAYPVFITLTLPSDQQHTDAEINRECLQPFLIQLRRDYGIENYFWRAEAQENGNVHYHLLTDRYIPRRYLQLAWNMRTEALGYLTRYFETSGSLTPPSTEVHRIRDKVQDKKTGAWRTVDPVDYLVDYALETPEPEPGEVPVGEERPRPKRLIGKRRNADGSTTTYVTRPITGRVWGMSDSLREIREPRAELTVDLLERLEAVRDRGSLRRVDSEHATHYFGPVITSLGRSDPRIWKLVQAYYLTVFGWLYPNELSPLITKGKRTKDARNLWIDLDNAALYNRLEVVVDGVQVRPTMDLERWKEQQRRGSQQVAA